MSDRKLEPYSVVIPTARDNVRTLSSIPDDIPVRIERDGSLNEARNIGVSNSGTPVVIILDDDLAFPAGLLDNLAARADPDTLLGIGDWDYGWIAGRCMVFYRSLWRELGGFDERLRSHMGDTDFAIRALRHGFDVEPMPREIFYHEPHERSITAWDHAWRGLYLALKHPIQAPRLAGGMLG